MSKTLFDLRRQTQQELSDYYATEEANALWRILLVELLGYKQTDLLVCPETKIPKKAEKQMAEALENLKQYRPIQYILGYSYFGDLHLAVNENVLIPRPETEELIAWIVERIDFEPTHVLDIGTGSACIALSLAKHFKNSRVEAIDVSAPAVYLAKQNAKRNHIENCYCYQHDILYDELAEDACYDLIVSNPPYITQKAKADMSKNVLDYEPHLALFVPDNDPLLFYRQIARLGRKHLSRRAFVFVEINEDFAQDCMELFRQESYSEVSLRQDINGKDRMIAARF